MEQQLSEKPNRESAELGALDSSLKALWERAQVAAELIARQRTEAQTLQRRVRELEEQLRRIEQELRDTQEQLKAQPPAQDLPETAGEPIFSNGEKEAMAGRVKDLLARLDAYL